MKDCMIIPNLLFENSIRLYEKKECIDLLEMVQKSDEILQLIMVGRFLD
jgi:hypothetical protein